MFRLKKQGPIARFLTLAAILCAVWTSVCAAEAMPPVSYTAYTSLYWLWEAGVPEAAEFSEAIGGEKVSLSKDSVPHYEELAPVNKLYIEMRYAALNEYIAGNRYQNVLDVACGFAPRSIAMARQGRMFVGTDFAPSIAEIRTVLPDCLSRKQQKRVHYAIADAKDQVGMMRAADRLEGPVCITMDGLMMYLTREEQATVLKNIKAILEKHGGAYVTSDFLAREFVKAATAVVYDDKDAQRVYRQSAEMYEKTASVDFDKAFFADADEAQKFIESQGLKVKRIPLFQRPVALQSAKDFNFGQYQKLEILKNELFLWEITVGN